MQHTTGVPTPDVQEVSSQSLPPHADSKTIAFEICICYPEGAVAEAWAKVPRYSFAFFK